MSNIKLIIHPSVQAVQGEKKEVLQPGLRTMAGNKNIDKLVLLVRWALKLKEGHHLPKFTGGFHEESGAFWFSFDKDTYFQRGGREVIRDLLQVFNSQGWPMVSCWGSDYWSGAFPRKIIVEQEQVVEVPKPSKKEDFKPKVIKGKRNNRSAQLVKIEVEEEE